MIDAAIRRGVLSFELRFRHPAWVVDGCAVGEGLPDARLPTAAIESRPPSQVA